MNDVNKLKNSKMEFIQQIDSLNAEANRFNNNLNMLNNNQGLMVSTKSIIETIEKIYKIDMNAFLNQSDQTLSFTL